MIAALKAQLARTSPQRVGEVLGPFRQTLRPNAYTALITDCGKRKDAAQALAIFATVPQKNVWHHSALIAALGQAGAWEAAVQQLMLLKDLHQRTGDEQLRPNNVTYSGAIAAVAKGARLDLAALLYNEMISAGLQPDGVTHYILLTACLRLQAFELADFLLADLHCRGVAARAPVYTTYLRQLCNTGRWNQAVTLFCAMQDVGQEPTPSMVVELMQCLLVSNKPHTAAFLLRESADSGLIKGSCFEDAVLKALVFQGAQAAAQQLHDHLVSRGWPSRPGYLQALERKFEQQQQQQQHHQHQHQHQQQAQDEATLAGQRHREAFEPLQQLQQLPPPPPPPSRLQSLSWQQQQQQQQQKQSQQQQARASGTAGSEAPSSEDMGSVLSEAQTDEAASVASSAMSSSTGSSSVAGCLACSTAAGSRSGTPAATEPEKAALVAGGLSVPAPALLPPNGQQQA